ncbi:serine/threonine-protein kinase 36 isoform X1 [Mauremys reevesii]|uniref:serine/threonine-protein kinase 36 isoform X1 n=1 Tax=Mauremys reevesii TaxID=260615 RepID=UPI00193FA596|nr:serine/threonine-protein kinase 36 isoform X1 [Mauremys reevesii]XP_039351750.1 serine/threonine-protein kinase 36 isoform X1 [Mauremys reevesii]XP_039351752.1 serine/threonine-protein kinase 36 isoform X1 [Mauremys reevesii]
MEKYHVLEMIGEGSFGRVYKGRRKYSAQVVALKFIPKVGRSEKELKNLQREIEIMRGLHHPNIVQMLDSFETDKEVVVVTDYAEGELFQILEDDGNLPEEQVQDIASQLVSALYYLHSHRILHRDMKPQNILLGKGGVIKLCDFGFARAMSIHTMVLTSIKGTPLYMAPELVQERPYDHTADLWAVGCILYELVVGTPPFYTNSIFQLVSLIVKDPITWPKAMSPSFKSFLQGLLMKDPRQRLAWPELLCHPFIAGRVTMIDDAERHGLANPFTSKLPPELQVLKEKQAHSLAPRSGQSRILRKARQRMAQEARRKEQLKADAPCEKEAARGGLGHKPKAAPGKAALRAGEQTARAPGDETQAGLGEEPSEAEWEAAEPPPTPREHRITQDYEREFPDVPAGGSEAGPRGRRSIETVDLENEELDSDDEWQHLIEATEPAALQLSTPLSLLGDPAFLQRIQARLQLCSQQVLEGMLEGASHLRPALRVLANLLATGCDSELLYSFCQAADLPQVLLHLLGQMLQSASSRQQPWCITLLTDLVGVITAYFTSEPPLERSRRRRSLQVFHEAAAGFLSLLPKLLAQPRDVETRLREQSSTCFARLCERMDGSSPCVSGPFYAGLLAEQRPLLDALLQGATLPQPAPEEPAREARATREQRERGADVFTAALAAVCSLPVGWNGCQEAKKQVAQRVAEKLAEERSPLLARLLAGLERPACSLNVLKVLYSCGHASKRLCRLLAKGQQVPSSLVRLVKGEVPMGERLRLEACEASLHLLALLTLQLQALPARVDLVVSAAAELFTQSAVVSLVSAAGFLLAQLGQHGAAIEVGHEEAMSAMTNALTAPAELHLPPPLGAGLYDGFLLLLLQLLAQGDAVTVRGFAGSELWNVAWHRFARMLRLAAAEPVMEGETPRPGQPTPEPDWTLVSPQGTALFLSLALCVFTREPHQCLPQLAHPDSVIMATFPKLLSLDFLGHLAQTQVGEDGDPELVSAVVLQACQLLCFPFSLDVDTETSRCVMKALRDAEIPAHLLQVCCHHLPFSETALPMSLLCHLGLSDERVIDQLVGVAAASNRASAFLSAILLSDSPVLMMDLLSLLTHVARACPAHLPFLQKILGGSDSAYQLLSHLLCHQEHPIRAKACSLVGNLLRHGQDFPRALQSQAGLLERLLELLSDQDESVRRSASFAVGNAAYQDGSLPLALGKAVPGVVRLLSDPQAKTRCNAASTLGNLGRQPAELGDVLIENRAPHLLLDVACHDSQPAVQEAALIALRSISQQPKIHQVLVSLKASEKLLALSVSEAQTSSYGSPRPSSAHHCKKLIHLLRPTHSA